VVTDTSASRQAALDALEREFDRRGVGRYTIVIMREPERDLHWDVGPIGRTPRHQRLRGVQAPRQPVKHCVVCDTDGHSSLSCVSITEYGDLDLCPFCERCGDHLPEDCPDRQDFIADDVWDFFVVARMRKCPIRTKAPELAWANVVSERFRLLPDEDPLSAYPHSLAFAKEWYDRVPDRCRSHNYAAEPLSLATDEATKRLEDVLRDQVELARPFPYISDGSDVDAPMPDQGAIEQEVAPGEEF
jgi:hypothetical protein